MSLRVAKVDAIEGTMEEENQVVLKYLCTSKDIEMTAEK